MATLSLYEILYGNFAGGLALNDVAEQDQLILSVIDNMQLVLNARAGSLAHLPDYGLPEMSTLLQGMPGSAHQLIQILSTVLLKYEPRLQGIDVTLLPQRQPGELRYAIEAELKDFGRVRFGTDFMPQGRVLVRHLKVQGYLDARTPL